MIITNVSGVRIFRKFTVVIFFYCWFCCLFVMQLFRYHLHTCHTEATLFDCCPFMCRDKLSLNSPFVQTGPYNTTTSLCSTIKSLLNSLISWNLSECIWSPLQIHLLRDCCKPVGDIRSISHQHTVISAKKQGIVYRMQDLCSWQLPTLAERMKWSSSKSISISEFQNVDIRNVIELQKSR